MHKETFEQIALPSDILGDALPFLQDDMDVTVLFYEGKPLSVTLPETVVLEIVEAEPTIKGQTATSSYKPALLSNGEKIMVPPYLEAGARVVVDTRDGSFVEKAKG
jgi:elongation factor P